MRTNVNENKNTCNDHVRLFNFTLYLICVINYYRISV